MRRQVPFLLFFQGSETCFCKFLCERKPFNILLCRRAMNWWVVGRVLYEASMGYSHNSCAVKKWSEHSKPEWV